jgi:hypothetical protein
MLSTVAPHQQMVASHPQYPLHVVVEGISAGDGIPNGVYRRAKELVNQRPVYHKTDALRPASLWFSGDWLLGSSIQSGATWVYATSSAMSPLSLTMLWQRLDNGQVEESARLIDANDVIPNAVSVAGQNYLWSQKLCDARPVFQRGSQYGEEAVFLFYRAHLAEWWLGPTIGGSVCYARARGSRLRVVPDMESFMWQLAVEHSDNVPNAKLSVPSVHALDIPASLEGGLGDKWGLPETATDAKTTYSWCVTFLVSVFILAGSIHWLGFSIMDIMSSVSAIGQNSPDHCCALSTPTSHTFDAFSKVESTKMSKPKSSKASLLSCVVCLEAPRDILLLPCRHVCCCKACADRLEKCPMCRPPKKGFSKVFL